MKLLIAGLWTLFVTLGTGYAVAAWKLGDDGSVEPPRLEGLRYTSLPTMSVPVIEKGAVQGYVVVRMVYTADASVLRNLASEPDAFISDEVFRALYANAQTAFGRLVRLDLEALAEEVRQRVNERMGDEVVQDLLVDGLNYVDLSKPNGSTAPQLPRDSAVLSALGEAGTGLDDSVASESAAARER